MSHKRVDKNVKTAMDHHGETWLSPAGQGCYLSPFWYDITGFNPEDIQNAPLLITRIVHPDDLHLFKTHLVKSCEKHLPGKMEFRIIRPDGEVRWIGHACIPVFDENGQYTGARGGNWDITERREADEIVKAQRDLGEALVKSLSLNEALQLCLKAAVKVSGLDAGGIFIREEATGDLNLFFAEGIAGEYVRNNSHYSANSRAAKVVAAGEPFYLNRQLILNLQDSDLIEEKMRSIAIIPFSDQGKIIGSLHLTSYIHNEIPDRSRYALEAVARYIGAAIARAQAEQNLRISEEKYRALFENAVVGIFQTAPEGKILTANPAMAGIFGYDSPSDLLRSVSDMAQLYANPADRLSIRRKIERIGQVHKYEVPCIRKDGQEILIAMSIRATQDQDGNIISYNGFIEDIAEQKKAEEVLRETETRYRLLFENSPIGIVILDPSTARPVEFNETAHRQLGYSREEFVRLNLSDIEVIETAEEIKVHIATIINEGRRTFETQHRTKQGDIRDVSVTAQFFTISGQQVYHCIWQDITDRKRAEEALQESEEKFRVLAESSPTAVMLYQDDRWIYANKAAEAICGYSEEEIRLMNFWDFVHPEFKQIIKKEGRKRQLGEKTTNRHEFKIIAKDGREKWVDLSGASTMLQGRLAGILSVLDITERKKMEDALRKSTERLRSIVEMSNAGIITMTSEGEILFANRQMAKMFGYDQQEFLSVNYFDLVASDERAGVTSNIKTLRYGESDRLSVERHYLRKDGTDLWGYVSVGRLDITRGVYQAVLVVFDITRLKQAETDNTLMEEHLRQAQKMEAIGTLAGGIAHDFNNILASMMGFTEMAVKEARQAVRQDYLEQVLQACDRAKNLVNQILAFSRMREQERYSVDLKLILQEALSLLRATLPATIEIKNDITEEETQVLADPTQIHQIIMNLGTNAAHAMQEKGGLLDIHLSNMEILHPTFTPHPDLPMGSYVQLSVRDTGHGIDDAFKDKIFDPFFTTKKAKEGTGLGLSVVCGIVKSCRGAIDVQSTVGQGTIFTIYLPRIRSESPALETSQENIDLRGHERILFVDDEEMLVKMARLFFQPLGYRITAITSSLEALRLFQEDPGAFDLVVTDMTMPQTTGIELSQALLKIRPELPIILCTGYGDSINTVEARKPNIRELVLKPFLLKDLGLRVRRILDN